METLTELYKCTWNTVDTYTPEPPNYTEEEELRALRPGVNEASFRARPHHIVHRTMGVDPNYTPLLGDHSVHSP
jgi:hypothetical protein